MPSSMSVGIFLFSGLTVLLLLPAALGFSLGLDTTSYMTVDQLTALKGQGYLHFVAQYYDGTKATPGSYNGLYAGLNTDGVNSIKSADAVPMASTDALHVPVYAPKTFIKYANWPGTWSSTWVQARIPIDYMNAQGGLIGRTFILINQNPSSRWSTTDQNANRVFMNDFISALWSFHPQIGIITNQTDFQAIFGSSYTPTYNNGVVPQLMLTSCNGNSDLNSPAYTPFNGFQNPLQVKQYQCNVQNLGGYNGINGDFFSYYQ